MNRTVATVRERERERERESYDLINNNSVLFNMPNIKNKNINTQGLCYFKIA